MVIINGQYSTDFDNKLTDEVNHVELVLNDNPLLSYEQLTQQDSIDPEESKTDNKLNYVASSVVSMMTEFLEQDMAEKKK